MTILAGTGVPHTFLMAITQVTSVLDPHSSDTSRLVTLWWITIGIGAVVFLTAVTLLVRALLRARLQDAEEWTDDDGKPALLIAGGVVPIVIVAILGIATFITVPADADEPEGEPLTIEVTGYQWWWEVRYPDLDIVTANEITVPVGVPVRLNVTSADVIHSLWAPQLQRPADLLPRQTISVHLTVEDPGVYRGFCGVYCGAQHAHMKLLVVAGPAKAFDEWVLVHSEPASDPASDLAMLGKEVFFEYGCDGCHAIEGTPAQGQVGPNLTHLANRRTIAAGTLPNNRGTLGGWVLDPQTIKPGSRMPPTAIPPDRLQALIAYLESLE